MTITLIYIIYRQYLCDIVLDCQRYSQLKRECAAKAVNIGKHIRQLELQNVPSAEVPESPGPSVIPRSDLSPAMKDFNFYPERRAGRGPKFVKTTLDRVYAISSTKMINQLKSQMEAKKVEQKKGGAQKKRKVTNQKTVQKKKKAVTREAELPDINEPSQDLSDHLDEGNNLQFSYLKKD